MVLAMLRRIDVPLVPDLVLSRLKLLL